jgi:hypothetical protein
MSFIEQLNHQLIQRAFIAFIKNYLIERVLSTTIFSLKISHSKFIQHKTVLVPKQGIPKCSHHMAHTGSHYENFRSIYHSHG